MELYVDIRKKLPGFALDVQFDTTSDVLGLLGASGAGKSMTLRCIAGLEKPDKGKIALNGRLLFDSGKDVNIPCRKRKTGFLFQNYALFPNMTVEQNIGFALESMDIKRRSGIIRQMIEMVKLGGMQNRFPSELSGGQQQRVALARALAIRPEALLLDEPFSALDDHLRSHLVKQLMDILSDYHGVTLFVTHNMEEAYRVCSKLVVLVEGKVEAQGEKEKLFLKPPTLAAAQLTGCKNFSAASFLCHHELEAVDWGIKLKTTEIITREIMYVGIRAHYIKLAAENDKDNVFQCWPCYVSEAPFKTTVYLSVGKEPSSPDRYQLQWEVSREKWLELQKCIPPWNIYLDPEKMIAINR